MAWYQRSYFKYIIILIFLSLLNNKIYVNCFNQQSLTFLKESIHNGIIFKYFPKISESSAKFVIDESLDFYIKNPNLKLSFCKYLDVKKNLLCEFNKKAPWAHQNFFLGIYNNLTVNLQLTHSSLLDFYELTEKNLTGEPRIQFIGTKIYIYPFQEKVFFNLDSIAMNDNLSSFLNYQDFLPDEKNSITAQNYIIRNKNELLNAVNSAYKINKNK